MINILLHSLYRALPNGSAGLSLSAASQATVPATAATAIDLLVKDKVSQPDQTN
ncbi:hypothetical protein N9467_01600 [Litorivicinus sp.]|nr:hypothetical protein [Litorivicinus sp.]